MRDEEKQPEVTECDAAQGDGSGGARDAGGEGVPNEAAMDRGEDAVAADVPGSAREKSPRKTAGDRTERSGKHGKKEPAADIERFEAELARLTGESDNLRAEIKDLKDKWLRSVAEFDNYRKRTRKEWDLLQQRTKADLILNVLSVADDFERAFSVVGDRDDDFIRGIRLIYNKFAATLEEVGVRKIEALGTAFDPTYHMAVAQIEREGAESDTVVEVVEEGYSLGDIVIRPAKVVIAK